MSQSVLHPRGLCGNELKLLAILAMTVDHIAWSLFQGYSMHPLALLMHAITNSETAMRVIANSQTAMQKIDTSAMDTEAIKNAARLAYMAEAMKYALIVVSSAPLLIAYPFVQKYFVAGMMVGAVKG